MKISAVILTKNEEKNIGTCLRSLMWCNEIIIIDDYSTDTTARSALRTVSKKVKVYNRHLNNDFAAQRNFGLRRAKGEWVLFVDADETVSKFLQNEILEKLQTSKNSKLQYDGYFIKRRDVFLGKELKHGENGNIKLLRLARKNLGIWKRKVHEYWQVDGKVGELDNYLIHEKGGLRDFVDKINFYSTIHAQELLAEGKKANLIKIIIWPIGKFFVNYFVKFGFLDGREGIVMAMMMSFHSFLSWSKAE